MIWNIAKKDFLLNLMTFKFTVGTILCIFLTATFVLVLVDDYQKKLEHYTANIANNQTELRKVKVYKNITPTIYRPPSVLSVFSEGLEKQISNSAKIELESNPVLNTTTKIDFGSQPEINVLISKPNPFLSIFPVLDISLIFKVVISLLALLVAYDVVSGEKEGGTLKLILSGDIPRHQILLGKFLAGLAILAIPITIAFIEGLLILEFYPMVDLSESDWICIGLMYIASLFFISVMYNFSLMFSCLTKKSTTSLMYVLLFWVIFMVVFPNGILSLAHRIRPLESKEKLDNQIRLLRERLDGECLEICKRFPAPGFSSTSRGAFGHTVWTLAEKRCLEAIQKMYALQTPIILSYADKIWQVENTYLNSLFRHKYLAHNLSRISPVSLYENVMSTLAGSDLMSFRYFMDSSRIYRNMVIDYLRSKTADFSSSCYFALCKEEDMIEYEKMGKIIMQASNESDRKKAMAAFNEFVRKVKNATPSLVLQDFPKFIYQQESIAKRLKRLIPDFGLLLFFNVLFFTISYVAFLRYDAR